MIKTCRHLKLNSFVEISKDVENIYLLIEEGDKPTEEDLIDAWLSIVDEYNTLIKTKSYSLSLRKRAEIESIKSRIKLISSVLSLLEYQSFELAERVESICDKVNLKPDKKALERKLNGLTIKLRLKINQLPKGSDATFDDLKESIERFRGFYIDSQKVTVSEWASYVLAAQRESEKQKKKQTKKRRSGRTV